MFVHLHKALEFLQVFRIAHVFGLPELVEVVLGLDEGMDWVSCAALVVHAAPDES